MTIMNVGDLYCLTEFAKANNIKRANQWPGTVPGLHIRFEHADDNNNHRYETYSLDTMIVPLEVSRTTIDNKSLRGVNSRRLKVLLVDGRIGIIYVDLTEWEPVHG